MASLTASSMLNKPVLWFLPVFCLYFGTGCRAPKPDAPFEGSPSVVSVSPDSGTGTQQTFKAKFTAPGGYRQLTSIRLLISADATGVNSCYVYYLTKNKAFSLINDAGTASVRAVLGSGASVENSQCIVSTKGATVTGSGNELEVGIPISFKAKFVGTKKLVLFAEDGIGGNSGLVLQGRWIVPKQ